MKFEDMVPLLTELMKLSNKINKPYFGSWKYNKGLFSTERNVIFRIMDLKLANLESLTSKMVQFCDVNGLLCRITYDYWFWQIVGNRDLVKKYGFSLVLPSNKSNEWFVPEVTIRIVLEGATFIIKALPDSKNDLIYCWGGGHDWEMSLVEVTEKLTEEIGKIVPVV